MESSDYNIEQEIDQYIDNLLSVEEKIAFEKRLESDHELKEMYESQAEARYLIKILGQEKAKDEIAAIWEEAKREMEEPKVIPFKSRFRPYILGVAAIALILILLSIFLPDADSPNLNLYQQLADKENANIRVPQVMGGLQEDLTFSNANEAYLDNKFGEAIILLEQVPTGFKQNDTVNFMIGYAYLQENDPQAAIQYFKMLVEKEEVNKTIQERAEWNLALAYLLNEDMEDAANTLKNISEVPDHFFKKMAVEGIAKIKELPNL